MAILDARGTMFFSQGKKFDPFSFYREGIFFFLFARTRFSRVNGKRCTVIHRFKVEVGKFYNFTSLSEIIEVLMEM